MKTYRELIESLDPDQRSAATIGTDAVIAAGAGSGKTRVLAARYVHLVVEKGIPVDEILALTFTRKAAAEMYARIYATLRELDHPAAREAIAVFYKARIDTIDAFCNAVVRSASRRYGIAPDFSIDNDRAQELAERLALPWFLEHRSSPAIRQLMRRYSFAELPRRLFADTATRYVPLSAPTDFSADLRRQRIAVASRLPAVLDRLFAIEASLASLSGGSGKAWERMTEILSRVPARPETPFTESGETVLEASAPRSDLVAMGRWLGELASVTNWGATKNPDALAAKEYLAELRILAAEYQGLVNFAANGNVVEETLALLAGFIGLYNRKKREAGILTFADSARMAVDALKTDPELRAAYASGVSAIMIDEFQDDNELQRDLLFFLATEPGKLFFVGDEKQSIYRFRGADVSVFRALERDLGSAGMPALGTNYRSEKPLIEAFNALFPRVFLNAALYGEAGFPLYEATFSPIHAHRSTPGLDAGITVLLVTEANFTGNDPDMLGPEETEAAEVAARIRSLVDSGFRVRDETNNEGGQTRPIRFDDVAVLFRTTSRQHLFEKHLRARSVPYQTESLTGLFADAPINDLYALLRVAVYPEDRTAYAMLLRSPFTSLDDESVTLALLDTLEPGSEGLFSERVALRLREGERKRFLAARELYLEIRGAADRIPATELVTLAWHRAGYRYETAKDPSLHRFAELYDYFFELARQADERGETLAIFLDRVFALMQSGERVEDLDIPVDKSGGVRLMTVHKSKGLEFPVVFVVNADNTGRSETNADPVYFSKEYGLTVNTGASEDAPDAASNWFWERVRDEERAKADAELRRLLYVAATRAEVRLFVSACLAGKADASDSPRDGETLAGLLGDLLDRKEENAKGKPVRLRSFLELLAAPLSLGDVPNCAIEEVMPARAIAQNDFTERPASFAARFAELASRVPLASYDSGERRRWAVTALAAEREREKGESRAPRKAGEDEFAALLAKTGVTPAEFGTFAHREIESRMTGIPAFMPAEIRPAVSEMAERFLVSETGKLALGSDWRENELGFVTRWTETSRELTVTGQMDLVFASGGTVFVVDFKTDREERPEDHAFQLAAYRKAARELYGMPVETRLFYLRTGNEVTVTESARK